MAVIITNTSGDTVATLSDATLNRTAAPIVLVGRGYGGFTKVLNEDLYRILENFASAAAPQNPVPGMIWYSSETLSMQYYNGTSWSNFSGGTTQTFLQTSPPTNPADDLIVGDLWFDTDDGNHPYRWSGTAWVSFRDLSYEAAVAESADNAYQTALDRIAVTAYATATSSDRIAVAADKATVSQAKSDVLDAQAEINQKVVQANAAATAAANSAASAAVSAPVYAYADRETANDSVSNGQRFRISGADGTGVYEYIRVGADFSTATLVTDWAGANAVSSLTTRVTDVEGIKSNVKSALSPKGVVPLVTVPGQDGFRRVTHGFRPDGNGTHAYFDPNTPRIEKIEASSIDQPGLIVPGARGRKTLTSNGGIVKAYDRQGYELGANTKRSYTAYTEGTSPTRKIMVAGDGIKPFCVSAAYSGDNFAPERNGAGIQWVNIPTPGAAARDPLPRFSYAHRFRTIADGVTHLVILACTGQSTSVGTDAGAPVTPTCPRPGYVLMFDKGRGPRLHRNEHGPNRVYYMLHEEDLRVVVDCQETQDGGAGETQWTQLAYELQKRLNASRGDDTAVIVGAVGIGSQPYKSVGSTTNPGIGPGRASYENLKLFIRQAYFAGRLAGIEEFTVIVGWPHHEASVSESQATFLSKMYEFQSTITADVAAFTDGQVTNVRFVTDGFTNGAQYGTVGTPRYYTEEAWAQLQAAIDQPNNFVYGNPCYVMPRLGDGTHFTSAGSARGGAFMGRAVANAILHADGLPLYVTSGNVAAGKWTGTLHLPFGAGTVTSSSPWVTGTTNLGYRLFRQDNSVEVPISSAVVVGNTIQVTPTAPPAGVPLWLYQAAYAEANEADGGPTGQAARCPVNDSNPDLDYFGDPFPNHLASQRFSITF